MVDIANWNYVFLTVSTMATFGLMLLIYYVNFHIITFNSFIEMKFTSSSFTCLKYVIQWVLVHLF